MLASSNYSYFSYDATVSSFPKDRFELAGSTKTLASNVRQTFKRMWNVDVPKP
jgi:hypothetical protein